MKKNYILLALLTIISSASIAQFGEIPNGDFESWTSTTLYEAPTDWQNTNTEEYRGYPVVSKSSTAETGTYSVKLETVLFGGDTLFGYVYHGQSGQNGPDGGIPYSATFNSIRVQIQSDIVAGDSLYMLMIRSMGGTDVDMMVKGIAGGVNSNWLQVDIPVSNTAQDSLFIGFIMGDVLNDITPNPGSWVLVDQVELLNNGVAVTAVPNQGFENWTTTSVEEPNSWYDLNMMLAGMNLENANKTTDAYSGTYAIEMTTIQAFGSDTIPSFLSMGVIDFNANGSPFLATPYMATPATFSGAYKYSPVNGDGAWITINFMQGGNVVGSHSEIFSTAQSIYTTFNSPLTITGVPDSILFVASSGDNPGSVLKLDDLQFSGGDVSVEEIDNATFSMYPNPASDFVTFNFESNNAYSYSVYNLIGKLIDSKENLKSITQLNVSDYPKGTYLIKISSGTETFTDKLIVK